MNSSGIPTSMRFQMIYQLLIGVESRDPTIIDISFLESLGFTDNLSCTAHLVDALTIGLYVAVNRLTWLYAHATSQFSSLAYFSATTYILRRQRKPQFS